MATTTYIQFPGINGNSKDRVHLGWFEVLSWSFGASQGEKSVDIKGMNFQIGTDSEGAPDLAKALSNGRLFNKVTLDVSREDESLNYRIEFNDVMLSSMTWTEIADFGIQFGTMNRINYIE